jgi:hypothetical protein
MSSERVALLSFGSRQQIAWATPEIAFMRREACSKGGVPGLLRLGCTSPQLGWLAALRRSRTLER